MPLYQFACACGWGTEQRAGYEIESVPCPGCAAPAHRAAVNRINATGFAIPAITGRPIPLSRYHEAQQQMVRDAERTGVPAPDVLGIAKQQANYIRRHAPELVRGT